MNNPSTPINTNFIAFWVIVCAVCSAIGAPIGVAIGENVGFPLGAFIGRTLQVSPALMNTLTSAFAGLLNGLIPSITLGIGQWLVLRKYVARAIWWIPASIVGVTVGSTVNSAVTGIIRLASGDAYNPFFLLLCGALVMSPIIGMIGAFPEWLVLRGQIKNAHWWIWTQAVLGVILTILNIFGAILSFAFPGLGRLLCMAGFSFLTGGLFGLATGIVLYQLIKRTQNNLVSTPVII